MDDTPISTPSPEGSTGAPVTAAPTTTLPPPPPPRPWTLLRARRRMVGGVCEGLAVASGVDVVWIRLLAVAAAFSGVGVLAYLALWALVPGEDTTIGRVARQAPPDNRRWLRIGIVAAALISVSNLFGGVWLVRGDDDPGGFFVGLTLLAVGAVLLWRRRRAETPAVPYVPTAPWPTTTADSAAATGSSSVAAHLPAPTPSADAPPPPASDAAFGGPVVTPPWWARRADADEGSPPHRARHLAVRVLIWMVVLGSAVVTAAVATAISVGALRMWAPGLWATLVIASLVGVAIAATVAPLRIVGVSLVVLVAVGVGSLASLRSDGGIGERIVRPATAVEIPQEYRFGMGHLVVDLSSLPTAQLPSTLRIRQGIGQLEVIVPDGVTVDVSTRVSAGESIVLGRSQDGTSVRERIVDPASGTATGSVTSQTVTLDVRLGFGQLVVCRANDSIAVANHRECTSY
jgi:MYXO-CTERM domain-containing protein